MPIPFLALGAAAAVAAAALRARSDSSSDAGPAGDTTPDTSGDTVASSTDVPADLSARTLSWQGELAAQAPELDIGFLLRWVQRESDGNPAAVGSLAQVQRDGWAREAGIGQVYFESRTTRVFGVTTDELRAGAITGTQLLSRDLTEPERLAQTSSLILMARQYLTDGGRLLVGLGVEPWSAEDMYCLAKLKHALPVLASAFLTKAADATGWDPFRAWVESLSLDESKAIYAGSGNYYGASGKPGWSRYLDNAQYTGRGA